MRSSGGCRAIRRSSEKEQLPALLARLDRSVFLRSLDAVHLMTAKAEHFDRLYSNDTHLLAACPSVHLKGVNPIPPTIDR